MKASEIIVGQDYAVERLGGAFYRARVVAVGDVVGESRGTGRYGLTRGHTTVTKRATVRFLRNDGTEYYDGTETVVLSKVTMTWGAYVEARDSDRARQERLDFALSEVEERCDKLLGREHVVRFARRNSYDRSVYAGQATIHASDLRKLLDAAYEAGRSSAVTS